MIDLNVNLIKDPVVRRNMSLLKAEMQQVPVGSIIAFAMKGTEEEIQNGDVKMAEGYIIADGRSLRRDNYRALFAIMGTKYGDGDSATETFALPDLDNSSVIYGVKYK